MKEEEEEERRILAYSLTEARLVYTLHVTQRLSDHNTIYHKCKHDICRYITVLPLFGYASLSVCLLVSRTTQKVVDEFS